MVLNITEVASKLNSTSFWIIWERNKKY